VRAMKPLWEASEHCTRVAGVVCRLLRVGKEEKVRMREEEGKRRG
jgi:hypothetical protein